MIPTMVISEQHEPGFHQTLCLFNSPYNSTHYGQEILYLLEIAPGKNPKIGVKPTSSWYEQC